MRLWLTAIALAGCTTYKVPATNPCDSYSTEELRQHCYDTNAASQPGHGRPLFKSKSDSTCVSKQQYDGSVKTTCD